MGQLTDKQIAKANEWYTSHKSHVDGIIKNVKSYPPTKWEDMNNPALWKDSHWAWFLTVHKDLLAQSGRAGVSKTLGHGFESRRGLLKKTIMKQIKKAVDFALCKIPVITMTCILFIMVSWLNSHLLKSSVSLLQMNISLMCVMSPMFLLMLSKSTVGKKVKMFNYICAAVIFASGVLLIYDMKNRPVLYRANNDVKISFLDTIVIVKTKSGNILTASRSSFDSDTISAYTSYKLDIFNDTTFPHIAIKTSKMSEYIYPQSH